MATDFKRLTPQKREQEKEKKRKHRKSTHTHFLHVFTPLLYPGLGKRRRLEATESCRVVTNRWCTLFFSFFSFLFTFFFFLVFFVLFPFSFFRSRSRFSFSRSSFHGQGELCAEKKGHEMGLARLVSTIAVFISDRYFRFHVHVLALVLASDCMHCIACLYSDCSFLLHQHIFGLCLRCWVAVGWMDGCMTAW